MIKTFCDLCGKEITGCEPRGRRVRRFIIKELKLKECFKEWKEITAHDDCIIELFRAKEETQNGE